MANKYSNHLYELIKSLTKAEKRYFKVFVSRHTASDSQNNAQILFDVIDKQSEYDEEKLLEQLKDHAFIKKFSIAKARLYDTILKSMHAFYSEKSKEQLLRNELHYIEILVQKSLYKQALKRLKSAKKQALKYNKKHLYLEILQWEKKLIEKDNYQTSDAAFLLKFSKEEKSVLEKLTLQSQLWELKSILFQKLNKIGRARNKEEVNYLKQDLEPIITTLEIPKKQVRLTYLFNHIKGAYYFAIQDNKKSLETVLETIQVLENNPNEFNEEPNILISALTNGIYLSMQEGDLSSSKDMYKKLKILTQHHEESGNNDLVIKLKSSLYSIQLLLIKLTCDFEAYDKISPRIVEFLNTNEEKLNSSRLAFLYYNIAHILFIKDEFGESLKWTNKLLNTLAIDESQEIYSFAELLNLFLHFELGNHELVQYNLKSTKRFLKTRNKLFEYEEIILGFFAKTTHHSFDKFETENQIQKLKEDLLVLNSQEKQLIPMEYFECINWAESKLSQNKLSDITRNKHTPLLSFKL